MAQLRDTPMRTEASLPYCAEELRENADFVMEAVRGNEHVLDYATNLLGNQRCGMPVGE